MALPGLCGEVSHALGETWNPSLSILGVEMPEGSKKGGLSGVGWGKMLPEQNGGRRSVGRWVPENAPQTPMA